MNIIVIKCFLLAKFILFVFLRLDFYELPFDILAMGLYAVTRNKFSMCKEQCLSMGKITILNRFFVLLSSVNEFN